MDDGDFIDFSQCSYTDDSHQDELRPTCQPLPPEELLNSYNSLITEQCCVSAMFSVALRGSVTW